MANVTISNLCGYKIDSQNLSEDLITIDEHGRVTTKDSELAQISEELSSEELDCLLGGCSGTTVNVNCKQK